MMVELNCWEIWLMGLEKLLDSCRKLAITPRVMVVSTPLRARAPPTIATITYWTLPMFTMIGIRMLA